MAKTPKPTDIRVTVPDVGDFVFAKRTMRDEIATQVEYARMIDGVSPTPWLEAVCGAMADLSVLTVKSPEGWDIEAMEPHDPETYAKLIAVHRGLLEKERTFRRGSAKADEAGGAVASQDDRVQVSPPV
jgi:hypothetical protein